MLDGLEVEYNQNDVNQFDLFRAKLVEGVEAKAEGGGGGGGSSDFSTAAVTAINNTNDDFNVYNSIIIVDESMQSETVLSVGTNNITAVLYKNSARWMFATGTVTVTGSATAETTQFGTGVTITGDCTITIS